MKKMGWSQGRASESGTANVGVRAGLVLASVALVASLGCGRSSRFEEASWERFRGPGGTGVSNEESLPVAWSKDGSGIRWSVEVPFGVSAPIVSRSQIILTGETPDDGNTSLEVLSLDLETGDPLWRTSVLSREREKFSIRSVMNSPAGPTPATDGERIYAYFGSHLAALDFEGKVVWLEEIDPNYLSEVRYGAGSSVTLTSDSVIVLRDREYANPKTEGWLAAYDKETGERRWRTQWQDTCCSYVTPVIVERESQTEILVALAGKMTSFDAATGKRIWRKAQKMNQPVASPVLIGDLLCSATGAHGVKDATCWTLDPTQRPRKVAKPLWNSRKTVASMASPVLYDDLLFAITDKGVMYCIDPRSGKIHWTERLAPGPYVASLTAGDGKVYAFSKRGKASVIAASAEFELLAENTMPHVEILNAPAVAGGCLLVRTDEHLTCIEGAPESKSGA